MKKWMLISVVILLTLTALLGACAKKQYQLTIAISGQGTTDPASGTSIYDSSKSLTVTATPDSGWKFNSWTGDAKGSSPSISITMDSKKGITANFSRISYNLTTGVNGNGTIDPSPGIHPYDSGTNINVSANPGNGWKFDGWSGDITESSPTVSLQIDGDKNVVANFSKRTYILTVNSSGNGSTNPGSGARTYDVGTVVSISATPSSGWRFAGWSGNVASPSSPNTTITINSDTTVTANFSQLSYNLTISSNGNGITSPSSGTSTYPQGTVVNISATPSSGWRFAGWNGNVASPSSPNTTVTINSDTTVTANFSQLPHLTISSNGSGITSPSSGTSTYPQGTVVNISAMPSSGWSFAGWSGNVASPSSPNTTITINSDTTVTANFSQLSYNLTISSNGNGITSPSSGTSTYPQGTVVNISATPSSGWRFAGWNGNVASPSSPNTTVTINSDTTVTANFSLASQSYGPYSLNIGTGSGDFSISSVHTGDKIQFNFQAAGSTVSYAVLDPSGNTILTGNGNVQSGNGNFIAATSGTYKLHFVSTGFFTPSVLTISYTNYFAP